MSRFFGFLIVISLIACAPSRIERFNDRLEEYNQALRWALAPRVKACVDFSQRATLMQDIGALLEEEKIVDFNVNDVQMNKKTKKASVTMTYTFYRNEDQSVKDRVETLSWEYKGEPESWYLVKRDVLTVKSASR